jgi:hypothetical protein
LWNKSLAACSLGTLAVMFILSDMNIGDLTINVIQALLLLLFIWLLYTLFRHPKEILFSFLRFCKHSNIPVSIIFAPIWIPAYFIDRKFNLGIYKNDDNSDDSIISSERKLTIKFEEYQKFLLIDSTPLETLVTVLSECYETTPEKDFEIIKYNENHNQIILKLTPDCSFYNYHYLLQWLTTYLLDTKQNDIFGLAINKSNMSLSYYSCLDTSGIHINSLIGKTLEGDKFSIYLLDDYEKEQWLDINNKLIIGKEVDIRQLSLQIDTLSFHELNNQHYR